MHWLNQLVANREKEEARRRNLQAAELLAKEREEEKEKAEQEARLAKFSSAKESLAPVIESDVQQIKIGLALNLSVETEPDHVRICKYVNLTHSSWIRYSVVISGEANRLAVRFEYYSLAEISKQSVVHVPGETVFQMKSGTNEAAEIRLPDKIETYTTTENVSSSREKTFTTTLDKFLAGGLADSLEWITKSALNKTRTIPPRYFFGNPEEKATGKLVDLVVRCILWSFAILLFIFLFLFAR